ncbi:GNAT family N-acetyltransferase [Flavobacterium psychrophilum]|uniref:GNAT family N-acetyltransferase n=1 Tax=Flavobacterium psychrophilum TaxID=96345 RepID=UPI001EE19953|nr:GNAT family N-acetyltransferase [Flavobacterium psychrophilum]
MERKKWDGFQTFSAQLEPASVAAAIASAKIHLSSEIEIKQKDLADKIAFFNQLLSNGNLPIISKNDSPVFFLGMATPISAYNFIHRLFKEGFFLNLGIYPAVPIKNTGIRITLSSHNKMEDIKALAEAMEHHFPIALEETNNSEYKIRKAFGLEIKKAENAELIQNQNLFIEEKTSIHDINKSEWNNFMGKQNIFDYDGMVYLEKTFSKHKDRTNQCDFYYYTINDNKGEVVLMTFFTSGLWKDDMLATESVSLQLEELRKTNPLYLTSKVLSMGCLFTEGSHYFINQEHPSVEKAWKLLLNNIEEKYNVLNADMLVLRDFEEDNIWNKTIQDQGYFKINMPESCVVQNQTWNTNEEFAEGLSPRSRKHFNKEILPYEKSYDVEIKEKLSESEITRAYQLYNNVKDNNYAINTFRYSKEIFENMNESPNWEFILIALKSDTVNPFTGVMFCYKNDKTVYVPELIGMDYSWAKEFQLYRQLLFQTIKRANALNIPKIDFGVSASFEKRKLGATPIPKVAYIQTRDNYAMEVMSTLQNDYKSIKK